MSKCSFCNNAVLEFQIFQAPNGKIYHKKCFDSAKGTPLNLLTPHSTYLHHLLFNIQHTQRELKKFSF